MALSRGEVEGLRTKSPYLFFVAMRREDLTGSMVRIFTDIEQARKQRDDSHERVDSLVSGRWGPTSAMSRAQLDTMRFKIFRVDGTGLYADLVHLAEEVE